MKMKKVKFYATLRGEGLITALPARVLGTFGDFWILIIVRNLFL